MVCPDASGEHRYLQFVVKHASGFGAAGFASATGCTCVGCLPRTIQRSGCAGRRADETAPGASFFRPDNSIVAWRRMCEQAGAAQSSEFMSPEAIDVALRRNCASRSNASRRAAQKAHMTTIQAPITATDLFATAEYRVDGRDKVSGRQEVYGRHPPPNTLWAAFATSPYATPRSCASIRLPPKRVPGVRPCSPRPTSGSGCGAGSIYDWPVLAWDDVRFDRRPRRGGRRRDARSGAEAAGLVDGRVRRAAGDARSVRGARRGRAGHSSRRRRRTSLSLYAASARVERPASEHARRSRIVRKASGDLDAIFASAHRVFEHRFLTPRQHAGYIEPHATMVWIDDDGTVHVQYAEQAAVPAARPAGAHVSGIPEERSSSSRRRSAAISAAKA